MRIQFLNVCEMLWIADIFNIWFVLNFLQEYQLTIGLKSWMIWAAYFFTFFFFYIFIVSMICVLLFAKASVSFMLPNRNESYMYY